MCSLWFNVLFAAMVLLRRTKVHIFFMEWLHLKKNTC